MLKISRLWTWHFLFILSLKHDAKPITYVQECVTPGKPCTIKRHWEQTKKERERRDSDIKEEVREKAEKGG